MCVWHTSIILEVVVVSFLTSFLSFKALTNPYWTFFSFSSSVGNLHQSARAHQLTLQDGCEHLPAGISYSIVILHGLGFCSSFSCNLSIRTSWLPSIKFLVASLSQKVEEILQAGGVNICHRISWREFRRDQLSTDLHWLQVFWSKCNCTTISQIVKIFNLSHLF